MERPSEKEYISQNIIRIKQLVMSEKYIFTDKFLTIWFI